MTLNALLKREAAVDGDLKLARRNPAEDVVRAFHELFASDGVVVQLRAGQVTRLVDEAKRRERRDGAGGVAEGNEDTAASQDVDGGLVRGEADAIEAATTTSVDPSPARSSNRSQPGSRASQRLSSFASFASIASFASAPSFASHHFHHTWSARGGL